MNTSLGVAQVSLRFVIESSDHSVSNHLPLSRHVSGFSLPGLPDHVAVVALWGPSVTWASPLPSQARHNGRPNRVHLRYGLIVHLQLLSTPPRGDAVTFGYRVPEHSGKDLHPAGSMQLQAH